LDPLSEIKTADFDVTRWMKQDIALEGVRAILRTAVAWESGAAVSKIPEKPLNT
jgi:hypothetical protein